MGYRHAPNSKAKDGCKTKRYITKDQADGYHHARLVRMGDGTFKVEVPIWSGEQGEEEEEEEEEKPASSAPAAAPQKEKKKAAQAAKPAAAGGKKKTPEPPAAVADAPPSAKRTRRSGA